MITAYIALGSNLGDKQKNIRQALTSIKDIKDTRLTNISGFYRTVPESTTPQPNFINAVAEIKTSLAPTELLKKLLRIENLMGRLRVKNQCLPRIIDLDILLYGPKTCRSRHLTIPHPRMHKRRFVLEPLCELAPDLMHPMINKPICALLKKL